MIRTDLLNRLDDVESALAEVAGQPLVVEMRPGETDAEAVQRSGAQRRTIILVERTREPSPMLPFHDDPLAQAGFTVNALAPQTAQEREILECLQNLLGYAIGADDELWQAERRAEAAEAELRALKAGC